MRWISDGEEDAIVIYRKRVLALGVACFAMLISGLWLTPGHLRVRLAIAFSLLILFHLTTERRRAIIFTVDKVKYTPAFSRTREFLLAEIVSLRRVTVYGSMGGRAVPIGAAELQLARGGTEILPLDFMKWEEIFARLERCISANQDSRRTLLP
jgi:hypothetical protein